MNSLFHKYSNKISSLFWKCWLVFGFEMYIGFRFLGVFTLSGQGLSVYLGGLVSDDDDDPHPPPPLYPPPPPPPPVTCHMSPVTCHQRYYAQ